MSLKVYSLAKMEKKDSGISDNAVTDIFGAVHILKHVWIGIIKICPFYKGCIKVSRLPPMNSIFLDK